jgi:hypothetical protein
LVRSGDDNRMHAFAPHGRAADAIGLTRSSVTQTLRYLEDVVGAPQFQCHARGMRPTAACADPLPVARQMLVVAGSRRWAAYWTLKKVRATHPRGHRAAAR